MPIVEYRLKGETRAHTVHVREGSDVIRGKPNTPYELREIGTERWIDCEDRQQWQD